MPSPCSKSPPLKNDKQCKTAVAFAPADLGLVWAKVKSSRALEICAGDSHAAHRRRYRNSIDPGPCSSWAIYAQKNTAASSSAVMASGSTAEIKLTRRSSGVAPLTSQSRERTLPTRC